MEVPPPFTNLQASRGGGGGGKTWQEEPGGEGGVLGLWGEFLERWDFIFIKESIFITCVPGVGRAGPCSSFWPR